MPLVDVITPTIPSRATLLEEAKASVQAQTFQDTGHLIKLDSDHLGPARIRNLLVADSSAKWLVFLDDDDLLDPEFIGLHLRHAKETNSDMVYSICRYPPSSKPRPPIREFDPARLLRGNYIPMTALVRRESFDKAGGFRPTVKFEDHQLWIDLYRTGARFGFLPQVCWTYRLHGSPWKPPVAVPAMVSVR